MMTTKTKNQGWMLRLLSALFLLSGLTACSSTEDKVEDPAKPQTPINDNDWETIPTTGGTIEKGDIAITFPSGTFAKDSKVALTEVKKGEILGEDEVSKFYQLTVPSLVKQSIKVKIKCDKKVDGSNVIAHIPSYHVSEGEFTYSDIILPSEFSNGEYTATLSASAKDNSPDNNISLSFGVAHLEYWGMHGRNFRATRGNDANSQFGETYTEGNVSWHWNISPAQINKYGEELTQYFDEMNVIIREAIKKIHDLGFAVTKRNVNVSFKVFKDPDMDGEFEQSAWANEQSTVAFNIRLLENYKTQPDKFRRSAIHEFMHDYQADYDLRSTKWWFSEGEDRQLMYESGAVWAEQFMGGSFSLEFAKKYIDQFVVSFTNIEDAVIKGSKQDANNFDSHKKYTNHGYGMSSLFQYLTKECTEYDMNDNNLVGLYEEWHKGTKSTKEVLSAWTGGKKHNIFTNYDYFLISLLSSDLIPGYNVSNMAEPGSIKFSLTNTKEEASGDCYPYGCIAHIITCNFAGKDLGSKKIVIKQEQKDVNTYVITSDGARKAFERKGFRADIEDSLVIEGSELEEQYYKSDKDATNFFLYLVTTAGDGKTAIPSKATIELQNQKGEGKVDPDKLTFSANGGSEKVKITAKGFRRFGHNDISPKYSSWLSAQNVKGGYVEITAQPNTTGLPRTGEVICYVTNEEFPTEEQKYPLPVKIIQEAGSDQTSNNIYSFKRATMAINVKSVNTNEDWHSDRWAEISGGASYGNGNKNDNTSEYTESGSVTNTTEGLHLFAVSDSKETGWNSGQWEGATEKNTHKTLSFDIANMDKIEEGKAIIRNVKYTSYSDYVREGEGRHEITDETFSTDIELVMDSSGLEKTNEGYGCWWRVNGESLKSATFSKKYYIHVDGYDDKNYVYNTLMPDNKNRVDIYIVFTKNSSSRSTDSHKQIPSTEQTLEF